MIWADAMDSRDADAARADTNLMENMMWSGGRWAAVVADEEFVV